MKYYCKKCKSELKLGVNVPLEKNEYCPVCKELMYTVSNYETPEQYEQRTGEQVSDYTAVFQYRGDWYGGNAINWRWECKSLVNAKHTVFCKYPTKNIVIANPPVPPPENWRLQ